MDAAHIIEIRTPSLESDLASQVRTGLSAKGSVPKSIPSLCLYDEAGLQLFEKITYSPNYYLTNTELAILERNADEIASSIPQGVFVIELGSGNLRKTSILLRALDRQAKAIDYFALDVCRSELVRSLRLLRHETPLTHVRTHGLHGTYEDVQRWLGPLRQPVIFLWLGSSICNNMPDAISTQLERIVGPKASLLVGFDGTTDKAKITKAYTDAPSTRGPGLFSRFFANALLNANGLLGARVFEADAWTYDFSWSEGLRAALLQVRCTRASQGFYKGERVFVVVSGKYGEQRMRRIWSQTGKEVVKDWNLDGYHIQLLAPQNKTLGHE